MRIPDLDVTAAFSISKRSFHIEEVSVPDLEVNSQPLKFVFEQPFGLQTLGVSGRLIVNTPTRTWRLHRIVFAMNNAEIYLRPRLFLSMSNARYFRERWRGAGAQLVTRMRAMRQPQFQSRAE
ncbi:MAG: hypothetical protein M3N98_01655 [Actinomycetota bacterium]|nr:hypothetical protein [Actinomycetota bacterium]